MNAPSFPGTAAADALDRTLAALADPSRRRIIERLRGGPMAAGELARSLGLPPPALSRHLRSLRIGGLVEGSHPEFDARVRVYALRPQPMIDLMRWLEETERMWSEQLATFKAHVERTGDSLYDDPTSPP